MKILEIEKTSINEFYDIISDILNSKEFQKRKKYKHHGEQSVYDHSLKISIISYKIAKIMGLDYKSAAIGGLLHDFYDKPWQECYDKKPFFQQHGFTHAKEASVNANKYFPEIMNKKIDDAIRKHMFPLNIKIPRYKESWVVTCVDKYVSMEIFKHPTKLFKYVGIKGKSK